MFKQASKYTVLFFLCFWGLAGSACFSQSVEDLYNLRFQTQRSFQIYKSYLFSIDSTQVVSDGAHPVRLRYRNVLTLKNGKTETVSRDCSLLYSKTIVLPTDAGKEAGCTVTLNCKSEIEGLRLEVIALDKEENPLYIDSVFIHPSNQWTDYSLNFNNAEARAVKVTIRREGCDEVNEGRSIYLNRVSIRLSDQELNNLPITSLVDSNDTRLNPGAIIPLSLQDDASLAGIRDWKDKKIIALGESVNGIQDLMEIQVQFMKYLITSENCKMILTNVDMAQCFRWNLYLQGKQKAIDEDKLMNELKRIFYSPKVFLNFMQWVRQYNERATVPVRIIGIADNEAELARRACLADYLLSVSTSRQDSIYYLETINNGRYSDIKEHVLQSQLSQTINKQDFQYLLFLIGEIEKINKRPYVPNTFLRRTPDTCLDEAERIERAIDIYLFTAEKAAFVAAHSRQINKHFFLDEKIGRIDSLGQYLYERYGKKYHAVSIQFGESDTPLFPFSFEQAAMESGIPYFYYPSGQLPNDIWGLNMAIRLAKINPYYSHILSHFDALVFIREVKGIRNENEKFYWGANYRKVIEDILDVDRLLKELKE